jgi:hypothetical protein
MIDQVQIDQRNVYVVNGVPVPNALVGHIYRLMPDWLLFRAWYLNHGAFVRKNPDVRIYLDSYFHEAHPAVALATLCSAVERLLRAALKAEQVTGPILEATLQPLLEYCVSKNQKFFNLLGMCCDPRSIWRINAIRIGSEHGEYSRDQKELLRSGWNPNDKDAEYLQIRDQRLLGAHSQLCRIFDRVDPETGLFSREWEPRGYSQCPVPQLHDTAGAPSP